LGFGLFGIYLAYELCEKFIFIGGEKMKQKKEKKLGLGKETIQDLDTVLDRDDQKWVKGGSQNDYVGTTQVPVFC
jgi:hypothetical protein